MNEDLKFDFHIYNNAEQDVNPPPKETCDLNQFNSYFDEVMQD